MNDRPEFHRPFLKWQSVLSTLLFLLLLMTAAYVRWSHLSMPLERDEGEYAYAARLILQGIPPFQEVYNMKMPGIYYAYAALMGLFGESVEGIRLGLVWVTLLNAIILYLLLSLLYSPWVGSAGSAFFCVLSLTPKMQAFSANAEHFLLLPALLGMVLMVLAVDRSKPWLLFLSGLMLGTAFVIKQHALAFLLFGAFYLVYAKGAGKDGDRHKALRNLLCFGLASPLPFLFVLLLMFVYGVFDRFWFWTMTYAGRYITMVSPLDGFMWLRSLMAHLVSSAPMPWILALAGLVGLLAYRGTRRQKAFAAGFLFFSFAAVSPGFYFRPHYIVLLLPAVGLLAGISLEVLGQAFRSHLMPTREKLGALLALFLLFASLGHSLYQNREALFSMSSAQLLRASYGMNPFPEAVEIAKFIQERSRPQDTLAVVGSEPEIYFYAGRRAATGYMYTYPLTENQPFAERMQEEMIFQIERSMPRFMVFVGNPFSWSITPGSPALLFEWFNRFVGENYRLVGTADTLSAHQTIYAWDEEARGYRKRSRFWMDVFERRSRP